MSDTKSARSGDKERDKRRREKESDSSSKDGRRGSHSHSKTPEESKEKGHKRKHSHHRSSEPRSSTEDKERRATSTIPAPYGPDFLRAIASGDSVKADGAFDVITGADAVEFTRNFVREEADETTSPGRAKSTSSQAHTPGTLSFAHNPAARRLHPVVFALPRSAAGGAGRKLVDYYMSWRGKTKTQPLTGLARRAGFLDAEFRRVRETINGEWMRVSRTLTGRSAVEERSSVPMLVRAPTDPQSPPRLAALLAASNANTTARRSKDTSSNNENPPPTVRSTSSPLPRAGVGIDNDRASVTSLPLLGMVRGVPMGNRAPLRVTNPNDRMSVSSSSDSVREPSKTKAKIPRASPLREGVAFDVPPDSESSTPRRLSKDTPKSEEGEKEKERMLIVLLDEKDGEKDGGDTWHGLERRLSERSSRPSHRGKKHGSPWMGPLAELDEDVMYVGSAEHSSDESESDDYDESDDEDDPHAYWGSRQDLGDARVIHRQRPRTDGEMPVKKLLSAMGYAYLTPEAFVAGDRYSPYGSYAPLPLPTPYNSPYAAAASMPLASPYVSPYASQMQLQMPPSNGYFSPAASSRSMGKGKTVYPPTAYTSPQNAQAGYASLAPAGYASPAPAGSASPAPAGYPSPYSSPMPAGYTSPMPARYASPLPAGYASPVPAGYASPYLPAGYVRPYITAAASPEGSFHSPASAAAASPYTDAAAAYSSPYVAPLQESFFA